MDGSAYTQSCARLYSPVVQLSCLEIHASGFANVEGHSVMMIINVLTTIAVTMTPFVLQATPSSRAEMRDRLDRIVTRSEPGWTLQPDRKGPGRQPGVGDSYEWRNVAQRGNVRMLVRHYPDAIAAKEYVQHLTLAVPSRLADGIGDAALVVYNGGEATVHFSVDETYVQLSVSRSEEFAMRLASSIAAELRR